MNGNYILAVVLLLFEAVMIVIFGVKGDYGDDAKPRVGQLISQQGGKEIPKLYPSSYVLCGSTN